MEFLKIGERISQMTNSAPDRCCDETRENIPWLVNGTLSDHATAALREHLEYCGECRTDLQLHTDMRTSVLGRDLTPMKPATKAEDIVAKVDRQSDHQAVKSSRVPILAALAAGVAIVAVSL